MMTQRLSEFLRKQIAADTYPEPASALHSSITDQMLPEVIADLKGRKPRVLDVGCGQGVALEKFTEWGCEAIGTTLNEEDLKVLTGKGLKVLYRMQEDLDDEWTDTFDLVWARHVLEHSIAPYWTLHEFKRVLRHGGLLYVEVPGPETACVHESNKNHYSVLGQRAWHYLIVRAGFEVVKAQHLKFTTGAGPDVYYSWMARKC